MWIGLGVGWLPIAAFAAVSLTACSGGGGGGAPDADTTPPAVISTAPANGADNVAASSTVSATFSEAMDPATLNTSTFILKDGGNNIG